MKILIVEDEPSLREVMQRALRQEGYVVETAATYAEADRRVSGYDYDCILLDIMLPDGNGLRLLERIKELRRKENVIIVSARDSLEDKVLGLDRGADDYLAQAFPYGRVAGPRQKRVAPQPQRRRYDRRFGQCVARPRESARLGGRPRTFFAEKGVRYPFLFHAATRTSGRQDGAGRSRMGRSRRSGGQFSFPVRPGEKSSSQARRSRSIRSRSRPFTGSAISS